MPLSKESLCKKFVPQEWVELHKAEFHARRCERNMKLPDLASSLRRLISQAYPEAVLTKDQIYQCVGGLRNMDVWSNNT